MLRQEENYFISGLNLSHYRDKSSPSEKALQITSLKLFHCIKVCDLEVVEGIEKNIKNYFFQYSWK